MEYIHIPVLLSQTIDGLNIREDGIYVDATAGGGGHSLEIVKRLTEGQLFSFDRDMQAVEKATEVLRGYKALVINENYSKIKEELKKRKVEEIDGILFDLGVSSRQLEGKDRGFSYLKDSRLDMRMGKSEKSGYDVVNGYTKQRLIDIFYKYGEEKYAVSIASSIIKQREKSPIKTTFELSDAIKKGVPAKARREKNPSRRVFQAIRIEVNDEFYHLDIGLDEAFSLLKPKGRMAVISFNSLEDKIVKRKMQKWSRGCECPPEFPVCVCGKKPQAKKLGRAIKAKEDEVERNRRSRSAILRIIEKI